MSVSWPPPACHRVPVTETGWFEVGDDSTQRAWGDPRLATWDYAFSSQQGCIEGKRELVTPDGSRLEFEYHSTAAVWIELSDDTASVLGAEPRFWRHLGLGRLRKDLSTPLDAEPERIWIQASQGEAVLVLRPEGQEETPVFFLIGPLGEGAQNLARTFESVSLTFFVGSGFLPRPTMRGLDIAVAEKRAWGGLVACTPEG
jgi:hypothetical protein